MGLLESSYESAEAGPLSPPADWLHRPPAPPSSRQRWPTARPRCRSRSLQRRRVVSMFWGPRPPERAGRSRSAEGGRQQPSPAAGAGAAAAGSDPAETQRGTPTGPTRSAPVTPTVVSDGGALDDPSDSPGGSPQDGQYHQTLRRLTGDIHGLLQRAEADDQEADDGFGDGVVDGGAPADGDASRDTDVLVMKCDSTVDGNHSLDSDGEHAADVKVTLLKDQTLAPMKVPLRTGGACDRLLSADGISRTLPCRPSPSPAVAVMTSNDAAGSPSAPTAAPGGGVARPARPAWLASATQRVCLAPGQDGSAPGHNSSGGVGAARTTLGDEGSAERVAGEERAGWAAAGEERLFDDSADDVLLMLMDSLPQPVTETRGEMERATETETETGVETDTEAETEMEEEAETKTEHVTRIASETEPEAESRLGQESERKPLSLIVITTVFDSTNDEPSPSPHHQLCQAGSPQCPVSQERTPRRPPDGHSAPPVCDEDRAGDGRRADLNCITSPPPASWAARDSSGATDGDGNRTDVSTDVGDGVSAADIAVDVVADAEAVVFPRACDVDSGGPLCLLSGSQLDPWLAEDVSYLTARPAAAPDGRADCSYTCHQRCRDLVTLDCPSDASSDLDLSEVTDPNQDEDLVEVQTLVRCDNVAVAEVRETDSTVKAEMIEKYNATSHGLYMTLSDDGRSFHGFIRVHMNLFRPINIVAGTRPPSIYDVMQSEQTLERTLASFYLPRDTVKALHIDNDTTVHEVISSLLKKFKIVDDPRKFALYERLSEHGESTKVKMRRLADSERPLELALSWSHHGVVNKKFVLQENDTGDILWDNFTLPELNNFLMMLNKEEEDYKRRVRQKYTEMKRRIAEQMDQLRPGGGGGHSAAAAVGGSVGAK